jgi:hypothetical protein
VEALYLAKLAVIMDIFEALRQSHSVQRELSDMLSNSQCSLSELADAFKTFKQELEAHETAEERYFYVPLLMDDNGTDLTRHALSEHHKIDELLHTVEQTDQSTVEWLDHIQALIAEVLHHLSEEEHRFFQMAGKILTPQQKLDLADQYLKEFKRQKEKRA